MDQVLTFNDKTYERRFQEFMDVLSGYEVLEANQIKKEWGFYLELAIDPNGWQGVWKVSKTICEKMKLLYPTVVLVYVEDINFRDLTAFVKILAVQDDIHLPESHIVPLIHLWPTKDQDDTVGLNLEGTANAIDMLHFFYNHLWMPWDIDDEENSDWISKHLEPRLRLHYDMKMGVLPRNIAERLKSLIAEAKTLQAKREILEEELSDEDDLDVDLDFTIDEKTKLNESVQTLMNLHIRITQIKSEVEIIENPVLRAVLLRQKKEQIEENSEENEVPQKWLIFKSNLTADEYIEYLKLAKENNPTELHYKTATSLQNALEASNPKDTILISAGQHTIRSVCSLEEGGFIKSLEKEKQKTEILSVNENIMMDFSGENVQIENVTINAGLSQCGILVRKGKVTLINCVLIGKSESSTNQGIIVLPEAELHLENCEISGFATGIVANSTSKVNMQHIGLSDVEIGVKIYDKSNINMHQCSFSSCKQYGLYVERDLDMEEPQTGDINILETVSGINAADCTFSCNGKSDVIITKVQKILPVRDLFSNPKFENTLNGSMLDVDDTDEMKDDDYQDLNDENMEV